MYYSFAWYFKGHPEVMTSSIFFFVLLLQLFYTDKDFNKADELHPENMYL